MISSPAICEPPAHRSDRPVGGSGLASRGGLSGGGAAYGEPGPCPREYNMEPPLNRPNPLPSPLADEVLRRIRHRPGLSLAGAGQLGSAGSGHPKGRGYLRIRASTVRDCVSAEALLADISHLSRLAWDQGWDIAGHAGRLDAFEIKIFPTVADPTRR